jgi:hypothetical protein
MKIRSEKIELVPVSELKFNPENRNIHPKEQIDRLALIIQESGFRSPGRISKQSGFVTVGEGRSRAAIQIGATHVPMMYQDYDTPEQEYQDSIADNAIDKWAYLDYSSIHNDLAKYGPFDLNLLGIPNFVADPSEKIPPSGALELSSKDFEVFNHTCPRCGFEFDSSKREREDSEGNLIE